MDIFDLINKGLAIKGAKDLKDRLNGKKNNSFESWAHGDDGRDNNDDWS